MMPDGKPDHKSPALQRYKNDLKMRVDQALGIQAAAQPVQEKPKPTEVIKPIEEVKSDLPITENNQDEPPKQTQEVKKPRAFVAESDLFDFSDIKIMTGSENVSVPKDSSAEKTTE